MKTVRRNGKITISFEENNLKRAEAEATLSAFEKRPEILYGVFDEFGDEGLPRKGIELFTLSGCCFIGTENLQEFNTNWSILKKDVFKIKPGIGYHSKIHFKKLRENDLEKVLAFVNNSDMKYISSAIRRDAIVDENYFDKYDFVIGNALKTISRGANTLFQEPVIRDEWYFEHSTRLSPRMIICLDQPSHSFSEKNGGIYFLKNSFEPSLEVADMVNYVVGKYIISKIKGGKPKYEEIFNAMFSDPQKGYFRETLALVAQTFTPEQGE